MEKHNIQHDYYILQNKSEKTPLSHLKINLNFIKSIGQNE